MSLFFAAASETHGLSGQDLKAGLFRALYAVGPRRNVLVIPPDFTRRHSRAGELTRFAWEYYGSRLRCVLPALGTHRPMAVREMEMMFGDIPADRFAVHDWRNGLATLGEVPAAFVREQSEGELDFAWPVEVNRMLVDGGFDLILSIGQVVPHEVAGMAGYNKNVLIGTGGAENIHKSHYLGAVYGMERIMGRADNPVRRVLNYASVRFLRSLPIVYALTVIGDQAVGLFIGDDIECFEKAAELSSGVNVTLLDRPIQKAVVYLNPEEFHSTWLGNKAIYRTRMAIADGGELVVLAPGVERFGEDAAIDALVRRYGYTGTPAIRRAVRDNADLAESLGAAAHLIHGSSEGRFTITYCPGHLSKEEIEAVGHRYAPLERMLERYDPAKMSAGPNVIAGKEVFFIANPAQGLWAHRGRFLLSQEDSRICGLAHRN
jgi:nickel-dependent lactate racemase